MGRPWGSDTLQGIEGYTRKHSYGVASDVYTGCGGLWTPNPTLLKGSSETLRVSITGGGDPATVAGHRGQSG